MSIQWYPGHMHKAGQEMDAALPGVDVIVEVLDARLPWSSANPMLETRLGAKPRLRVLMRADLADPVLTERWLRTLDDAGDREADVDGERTDAATNGADARGQAGDTDADGTTRDIAGPTGGDENGAGEERRDADAGEGGTISAAGTGEGNARPGSSARAEAALAASTEWPETIREIPARLAELAPSGRASRAGPRTAMVVGIPNVGKSTLINRLAGRTVAKTGNEPAVTRRQQSVALGEGWRLRDTPGVLWPNVENPESGYRLAASGAIRDTAMDSAEVAAWLLEALAARYPDLLAARYGTAHESGGTADGATREDEAVRASDGVARLERIGRARGCLGGGGLVDLDRAGRLVLQEFRRGALGRITLETPAMRAAERVATAARRSALEERRAARREARRARRRRR